MTGTLYLVGVGPGDPELITLKAARIIAAANVVAYPVANGNTTLALDIARVHVSPTSTLEPIVIPMKVRKPDSARLPTEYDAYAEAAVRIAMHLDAGRSVAYLCEGDPLFYGTAVYLLWELMDSQRIEIIPGVTSISAAVAAARRPLSVGHEGVTILTGTMPDVALRQAFAAGGSFAIIKIGRHFDRLRSLLEDMGLEGEALLVERASTSQQRVVYIADEPPGEKAYFSLILAFSGPEFWR